MPRRLWLRGAVVAVVILGSVWYLYPPRKTINLGLDLQGGIHLVLGVETGKHVASQTDRAAEDLKAALERKGVALRRIAREGEAAIAVELANPANWNDALTVAAEFTGRFERQGEDQAAGDSRAQDKHSSRLGAEQCLSNSKRRSLRTPPWRMSSAIRFLKWCACRPPSSSD